MLDAGVEDAEALEKFAGCQRFAQSTAGDEGNIEVKCGEKQVIIREQYLK